MGDSVAVDATLGHGVFPPEKSAKNFLWGLRRSPLGAITFIHFNLPSEGRGVGHRPVNQFSQPVIIIGGRGLVDAHQACRRARLPPSHKMLHEVALLPRTNSTLSHAVFNNTLLALSRTAPNLISCYCAKNIGGR